MSLEAFVWASGLPLDVVGPTAYRVLVKLANHAHSDGANAWRDNARMAAEFGCSRRTIERAVRELKMHRLIIPGDQRLVDHLRGDRHPVVYNLNLLYGTAWDRQERLDGLTDDDGPHDPTSVSRPDIQRPNDPTSGVAQGTVIEPTNSSTRGDHRGSVGSFASPCPASRTGQHVPSSPRSGGFCTVCGAQPQAVAS